MSESPSWPWQFYNGVFRHLKGVPRNIVRAMRTAWDSNYVRLAEMLYLQKGTNSPGDRPIMFLLSPNNQRVAVLLNTTQDPGAGYLSLGVANGSTAAGLFIGTSSDPVDPQMRLGVTSLVFYDEQGTTEAISIDAATGYFQFHTTTTGLTSNGQIWRDTTQKGLAAYWGSAQHYLPGVWGTVTSTVTCANTATETTLDSREEPANYLVAGKTLRVFFTGKHTTKAAPVGTLTIQIKRGSVTILGITYTPNASITTAHWEIYAEMTCRTTGAAGTMAASGAFKHFDYSAGAAANILYAEEMAGSTTTAIDTTAAATWTLTATWATANASNSIGIWTGSWEWLR